MKTIKVKFCDGFFEDDYVFLPILKKHYNVVFSDEPEYLFYSVFGREHLKYDCIKIFSTGEAAVPNFNECDYATGFDYMDFGDRYLRLPLCSIMFRNGRNIMEEAIQRGGQLAQPENRKFCSFVVSNKNGINERERFFDLLSAYRTVDSGGRFRNNIGGPVENKLLFEKEHKFSICFENECYSGYTTEKIVDAFAAGTIPIYLGDPKIGEQFNRKAFVNVADYDSLETAVDQVKRIDCDDVLYVQMLNEPIFCDGVRPPGLKELEEFLCNIIDQEMDTAYRRPNNPYSRKVERPYGCFTKGCDILLNLCNKVKRIK